MRIAVLDDYTDIVRSLDAFSQLDGHDVTVLTEHVADPAALADRLQGVEALALNRERTTVGEDLLRRLPDLRLLSATGGYPHIDVDACTRYGVALAVGGDASTPSYATAELAWGLILSSARHLPEQVESTRRGTWQTQVGRTLRGATLGVLGYGGLGQLVAGFGQAFGMQVLVWSGESSRAKAAEDGVAVAGSQRALFAASDVLSVHVRLNEVTRGLVTAEDLRVMKPDAVFVNTSRAGLVEPGALVAALAAGRPGSAAVDVYDSEPASADDPLLMRDDVIGTPHLGYVSRESYEAMYGTIFSQITAFAAGRPTGVVNATRR
jgi:D-3-phosphoglycerate dehydrogenase